MVNIRPKACPPAMKLPIFYLYAVEQLEHHGYKQYEISNFAKPGYEGRHNLIYWDCGDYLGLGPAAHSCMGGRRFYYPPDTAAFLNDAAAPVMDGSCGAEDYPYFTAASAQRPFAGCIRKNFTGKNSPPHSWPLCKTASGRAMQALTAAPLP